MVTPAQTRHVCLICTCESRHGFTILLSVDVDSQSVRAYDLYRVHRPFPDKNVTELSGQGLFPHTHYLSVLFNIVKPTTGKGRHRELRPHISLAPSIEKGREELERYVSCG